MKSFFLTIFILFTFGFTYGQVKCSATESSGSGYSALINAGFEIEDPDCVHSTFGPHITQTYDDLLERNVFEFHSHIIEDNDRCLVFDRVRMEIKGGPGSDEELKHPEGSTSYYRWKFMLPVDFVGTSSFCHIFQDKIVGGDDTSFPIITITPRKSIIEVIHNGGDSGSDLGRLASADLDLFRGRWIEGYIKEIHSELGTFEIILKDIATGNILIQYKNSNIDMWRAGAEYARPKWGIYRAKGDDLKDEIIKFADYCVSETSADLCPADTFQIKDKEAPTIPKNLTASDIMIKSAILSWESSTDNVGVSSYILYQDGLEVYNGEKLSIEVNLVGSTTYSFKVAAIDDAGNISEPSPILMVTTDDANDLPGIATKPIPSDLSIDVSLDINLSWATGKNTDHFNIYFGESNNPVLVANQVNTSYKVIDLKTNTTYYWSIGSVNDNGEIKSPIWSFTTGIGNKDFPWKVYRANERLDIEADFFKVLDIPAAPTLDLVTDDAAHLGNKIYTYHESGEEKFRWQNEISSQDTAITIVARIKAINQDINCICYFEVKAFGWREKVRVNQSTIKLERSTPVIENTLPFDILADFHMLRMTMKGNKTHIYLDENPKPFAVGSSTTTDSGFDFEWGKSGSNECGGSIDWLTILHNEAYAPGEGPKLPQDLIPFNSEPVGTNDLDLNLFKIYPNPTSSLLVVELKQPSDLHVNIYDQQGRFLKSINGHTRVEFNINNYPNGTYILKLTDGQGKSATRNIILQK